MNKDYFFSIVILVLSELFGICCTCELIIILVFAGCSRTGEIMLPSDEMAHYLAMNGEQGALLWLMQEKDSLKVRESCAHRSGSLCIKASFIIHLFENVL